MRQLVHDMRNPVGAVGIGVDMLAGPFAASLEDQVMPDVAGIVEAARELAEW